MRQRIHAALSGLLIAGAILHATVARAQAVSRGAAPLVFRGVTIIDVRDGRRLPNYSVVIRGTRVRAMGPSARVRVPPGARVVEARSKYLIPGLWDMHVHPIDYADIFYPLFVANGVTGVRDAGSSTPLATFNRWKQEIAAGTRVGPRLFVAGPSINGCPGFGFSHNFCVSTPDEARQVVDFLKQAGADFIKTYAMSRQLYLAIAREARRIGIPFGGHFYQGTGIGGQEISDSGARFLDHQTWFVPNVCGEMGEAPPAFDAAQCTAAAVRLRQNGTWVVMTPVAFGPAVFPQLGYDHVIPYLPDSLAERFADGLRSAGARRDSAAPGLPRRPRTLADWQVVFASPGNPFPGNPNPWLRDSTGRSPMFLDYAETRGLPIVVGTDAALGFGNYAGFGVHDALVSFVLGGMTPLEALQTATLNPALALQATDSLGTVAPGKLADLVLLDADPLVDITNTTRIRAVVASGRYFDRRALDRLLAQAKRAAHRPR